VAKHLVKVNSKAVTGKETAFETWYNTIHLGEVLALPGFNAGQQFRNPQDDLSAFSHFALFEVESDDIDATLAHLGNEFASGKMTPTDALDVNTPPEIVVYQPTGSLQQPTTPG